MTVEVPKGVAHSYGDQATVLLPVIERLTTDASAPTMQRFAPLLKNATAEQLMAVGRAVATQRRSIAVTGSQALAPSAWRSSNLVLPSRAAMSALDTEALVQGFGDSFRVAPVGWLHLERLEMFPVGMEHGQLVNSVPLTPHETVNISHREWTITSQTFENIVEDFFEGFSEQGVAEKTDIAVSST
jgi:hypothetical protein